MLLLAPPPWFSAVGVSGSSGCPGVHLQLLFLGCLATRSTFVCPKTPRGARDMTPARSPGRPKKADLPAAENTRFGCSGQFFLFSITSPGVPHAIKPFFMHQLTVFATFSSHLDPPGHLFRPNLATCCPYFSNFLVCKSNIPAKPLLTILSSPK